MSGAEIRGLKVLRVDHGGRDPAHRLGERALHDLGFDLTLVVPERWPESGSESSIREESFEIVELPVRRPGDVNRHSADRRTAGEIIRAATPDVLDIHEEPFSAAARAWLRAAPHDLPVVMYTAQNVDKRFPAPFAQYERAALGRVAGLYPCSSQAAAVARGKGFGGVIDVLPLGYDDGVFVAGSQSTRSEELVLAVFGRLVPEKGILDAVRVLARVAGARPARLIVTGEGPEESAARELADELGVRSRVEFRGWQPTDQLAATYRAAHFVLVPSRPTATWVEQFGRVIVEAQASGAVVAGYRSGAIPEVAGDAAILVDVGDTAALADAVLAASSDDGAYARLRGRGIEMSKTRTWRSVAERQALLYCRVQAHDSETKRPARSPGARRAAARAEFGSTARTTTGYRPFALPILRNGGTAPAVIASSLDRFAELRARVTGGGTGA